MARSAIYRVSAPVDYYFQPLQMYRAPGTQFRGIFAPGSVEPPGGARPRAAKRAESRLRKSAQGVVGRGGAGQMAVGAGAGAERGFEAGAGQMAEALARGLSSAGVVDYADMAAADVNSDRLAVFQGIGIDTKENAREVAASSDVIFIAVKPFAVQPVLADLAASGALTERHLIVSIAAGVPLGKMQQWAGEGVRIVRVMPNTPCLVGATAAGETWCCHESGEERNRAGRGAGEGHVCLGACRTTSFLSPCPPIPPLPFVLLPHPAMSLGESATEEDAELVKAMFGAVGEVYEVEERLLDAVTGLSGSGPAYVFVAIEALADAGAYVFVAIEALADGGTAAGLPRKVALSLAAQTVSDAVEWGEHRHSVPGTTIAGLHELERGGFRSLLMNAVVAAANRSKELSN
ncbi:unnamed protein product [Closterium sp. Naga37s-1]|nr:unnamed protein product [Closterium sp. Naga37s-1]